MVPFLSESLSASPNLHTIRTTTGLVGEGSLSIFDTLDEMESRGDFEGFLRSWNHDGKLLLHAKISARFLDFSDIPRSDMLSCGSDGLFTVRYIAEDESERERVLRLHSRESWQDLTDYNGFDVPMEVIGRMEELEGYSPAERRGRGIKVSDAGWAVLEEWYGAEKTRREGLEGHPGEHTSLRE